MPETTSHPTPQVLAAFALGQLPDSAATVVAQHLGTCSTCLESVTGQPADSFMGKVQGAKPGQSVPPGPSSRTRVPSGPLKLESTGASPTPLDNLPPELANHTKYRIERELGRGGMGVVYQAMQTRMDRSVALKVINPSVLEHPDVLPRFEAEVKAVAKLDHPNIARAFDADQVGSLHLLVMEFVEGMNLADVVKRKGPLPVAHACHYIRQAALGLQHAFEKGMVHRDIKPHNLMLTPRGQVKILDFGLARLRNEGAKKSGRLTTLGAFMGTPEYVSPEQATDARSADTCADIYSLGCTLYFLLTGRPPFQEETIVQLVLAQIEKEPQPLQEVRPEVPAELSAVVARMLAKDPGQRYQKPVEVAQALLPFVKAGAKGSWGKVTVPPGVASPGAGTVMGAGTSKVPGLRPGLATQMPAGGTAAKEPADPFADLAVVSVAPKQAKKGRKATKGLAGEWYKRKPVLAGAAAGVLMIALVVLWACGAFRLKTQDGTIVVDNLPADAEVFVDGEKVALKLTGDDKPIEIQVAPGKRKLEIKTAGFKMETQEVTLAAGERKPIGIRLEPLAAAPLVAAPEKIEPPPRFKNALGMEFALVPKGKAWLGGGGGKPGDKEVEFEHDFYLGVYDVTQGEWQQILGTNPSCFRPGGSMGVRVRDVPDADLKRFPVENISWPDTQVFLAALNKREPANGWTYRLPTEAEWEYACRGGPMTDRAAGAWDFYFDKPTLELLPTQANFKHPGCLQRTCKVGSYTPNGLGLYDMHGNVIEWCADEWFGRGRRYRGGCWSDGADRCRAGFVFGNGDPRSHDNYLGMRVARVPTDQDRADGTTSPTNAGSDPDRKAAEYVLSIGGTVRVNGDERDLRSADPDKDLFPWTPREFDKDRDLKAVADLPRESFQLAWVELRNNKQVDDAGLAHFEGCKHLMYLGLWGTRVSDTGLTHFKDCKNLRQLNLCITPVSDVGLAYFKDCKNLTALGLEGTQVSDVGLAYFTDSKNLTHISLQNTKVTDAGLAHLTVCKNLMSIDLNRTQVSDLGLAHLKDCEELRMLAVVFTKVTKAGLDDLRKKFPKCRIIEH